MAGRWLSLVVVSVVAIVPATAQAGAILAAQRLGRVWQWLPGAPAS